MESEKIDQLEQEGYVMSSFALSVSVPPALLLRQRGAWLHLRRHQNPGAAPDGGSSDFKLVDFSAVVDIKEPLRWLLEAMACGCPVVVSRLPVLQEVASGGGGGDGGDRGDGGAAAVFVNQLQPSSFVDAVVASLSGACPEVLGPGCRHLTSSIMAP